jgi:hypothetical protein
MKKPFNETKLGKFIGKASALVPEIVDVAVAVGSGNISGAIKEVGDLLGKKSGQNPLIEKLHEEFESTKHTFAEELKSFELEVEDRKDARANKEDKDLKKVMAYFSLGGFTFFSLVQFYLCYLILVDGYKVNEFLIMTVSGNQGVFTALLFTLKDYLFGGSMKK